MANATLKYIFSIAVSAICVRANYVGLSDRKRDLCRALAVGFSLSPLDGDNIFSSKVEGVDFSQVVGFNDTSIYDACETSVRAVIDGSSLTSSLSDEVKTLLSEVANSILFGAALNQSVIYEDLSFYIGRALQESVKQIFGFSPFELDEREYIIHPFDIEIIDSLISNNNYNSISSQISTSPPTKEIDLVHYNWYDMSGVFLGPNLDVMKSAENQYYYLSGQLTYPQIEQSLNFCRETGLSIVTETGTIETHYYLNAPCVDRNSYVGPVPNTKFYREFNDGPYSSGNFTSDTKSAFIEFDKTKLDSKEYAGNAAKLYLYNLDSTGGQAALTNSSVLYDINGEYNLTHEHSYAPMDTGCYPKYQVMRVGGTGLRSKCIAYDGNGNCITCVETGVTGFKFALLELGTGYSGEYAYIISNPFNSGDRVLKRGLNYNENPYKGTVSNGVINTYQTDEDGNPIWYVGPPQISGNDILPFLAFSSDFENIVAGKTAKVVLYPAFGSSNNSKGVASDRSFTVSSKPIATGEDANSYSIETIYEQGIYPKAKFYQEIQSYTAGDDDVKLKFFGMGNNFGGTHNFIATKQENAGYFYTGYNDGETSLDLLVGESEPYKIGSPTTGVQYIDGYTGVANGQFAEISKQYAHDNSGNNIQYYFFDNRLVPAGVTVTNTSGWASLAPLPTGLENNADYIRHYNVQKNENNFPRYYRGPYSKIGKKFLYPNAEQAFGDFDVPTNGFPTSFKYKIEVREEAVKEFYAKYTIQNGGVSEPEYVPVIRANPNNVEYSAMTDIFDCSGPDCDFNEREATGNFFYNDSITGVRENWVYYSSPPVRSVYFNAGAASAFNIPTISLFSSIPIASFNISSGNTLSIDSLLVIDPAKNYLYEGYILIKNQFYPVRNGIYTLENLGFETYRWNQTSFGVENTDIFITNGAVYNNTAWRQTTPNPIVGVNDIIFTQINIEPTNITENSNGFNFTLPNSYVTESLYKENANFEQGILTESVNFDFLSGSNGVLTPTPNYSNRNLFHAYTGYEISGELKYTKPAFNLSKGQIDRNLAIQSVGLISGGCYSYYYSDGFGGFSPSLATGVANLYVKNLDGSTFYTDSGQDPIHQEYFGGRIGLNAENEGGNHSKSSIGDSWMGLNFRDFGYYCTINGDGECYDISRTGIWNPDATVNSNRVPENDDHWFLIDLKPSGVRIHTRALDYNPMSFEYPNNPFTIESTPPSVWLNGSESFMTFSESGAMFSIDLASYMPTTTSTGYNYYYSDRSGFYIGAFDRDVEVFAIQPLLGYTEMFINGRLVADTINGADSPTQCNSPKAISGESYTSIFSAGGYSSTSVLQDIKVIAYIPSGEKCYIDLKNNYDTSIYDLANDLPIGFPSASYLYVRARKTLNNNVIGANSVASADFIRKFLQVSGTDFWLHNHNLTNNGMERVYEIPENIQNLKDSTHTFISFSRTGKMYPTPTTDFANYIATDGDGTRYLTVDGVEGYWAAKTVGQSDPVYFSGWREGSRISFKFTELEPVYGDIPYESHSIVTPSGSCILSGEMGYLGQADKAIFSEGVYLKDMTLNDGIRDNIYGPNYVSDVLARVPFFEYPSGTFINPIVSAPSTMKQRKQYAIDRESISYNGINTRAPYNYNKLLWPALSDLRTLNPEETIEAIPPDDGNTYTNSTALISASQGQRLPNGKNNPDNRKVYQVANQYQTYDSVATDALMNPTTFITSGFGFKTELRQPEEGVLVPKGTTLNDVILGLV